MELLESFMASVYILWNYVLENYTYWDIHNKMKIV